MGRGTEPRSHYAGFFAVIRSVTGESIPSRRVFSWKNAVSCLR
jgi:hypothetical protein